MPPQYYPFTAIQWLGPTAVVAIVATAIVAALKRPAVWSISFCITACLLLVGIVANHLALNTFGTQVPASEGGPFTRFEPTLRLAGLLAQFLGFGSVFIGSISAIRILTAKGDLPDHTPPNSDDRDAAH
jgi:hypothetical protein